MDKQYLKQRDPQPEQDLCSPIAGCTPRRASPRKMLLEKVESLRQEAHALEALAFHLPENLPEAVEITLANTIALRIYR